RGFPASGPDGPIESLDGDICTGVIGVCRRRVGRFFGIVAPEALASVTPSRESTARAMMALLRQSGLGFQRRRLATASPSCGGLFFVFFVHRLRLFAAVGGQRPNKSDISSKFFRPATWPAIRRECLDLNRRFARRRPLRVHHTSGAPDAPRSRP